MVNLFRKSRNSVTIGSVATLARIGYAMAPGLSRWVMRNGVEGYLSQANQSPVTSGNLFQPMAEGRSTQGGWRSPAKRSPPGLPVFCSQRR
jgi:hypothetical protein